MHLPPRSLFFIFLSLMFFTATAQENAKRKTLLTLAPLALVDPYDGQSFRPGLEVALNKKTAVTLETGLYVPYFQSTKIRPHGYLIKPGFRYYLDADPNFLGRYLAVEYLFKDQAYNFKDSLEMGGQRFEKQYAMKRTVHALSLRFGKSRTLGPKMILDYYIGLGVRYLHATSDLPEAESESILSGSDGDCPVQQDILRKTGWRWQPNLLLGIRIGYRL